MQYYPIVKNWRKIKKHLNNERLTKILHKDFNKFTWGRWHQKFPGEMGKYPHDYESCDWWLDKKGQKPEYWNYVKHSACHWLVNFNLKLAQLVEPNKPWRIVTSQEHSTVWDGEKTLFDMNFLALGISPKNSFKIANKDKIHLKVGELMRVYMTPPFWAENPEIKPKDWSKRENDKF